MQFTYKGLKAKLEKHTVTGEEVDRNLQRLLQQNPRIAEVTDRPTQLGDEVILNYAGFCDGEQFAGGTAENQTLVLGSGMFIPGFEEQLVDKVPGEEVTVKVTFPETYHADNLAGKAAEFKCKILKIRIKTPYDLDDTFAKEVGQCDTLEEMRTRLQESLQAYADERGEMDLQDRLLNQAAQTLELTITDQMLEEAVEDQMNNLRARLAQQGLSLEMYCQFMSTTEQALREDVKPTAEAALRCRAAIDEIVLAEGLEANQEEIGQTLAAICRQNNITMDQLKEQYDAALEQAVINSVLTGKVMRLIRDAAIVEE
jgi:trigger factor